MQLNTNISSLYLICVQIFAQFLLSAKFVAQVFCLYIYFLDFAQM